MSKPEPIREGDEFKYKGLRHTWVVIGTKPFGIVQLFCKPKLHFMDTNCQQIRMHVANGVVKRVKPKVDR